MSQLLDETGLIRVIYPEQFLPKKCVIVVVVPLAKQDRIKANLVRRLQDRRSFGIVSDVGKFGISLCVFVECPHIALGDMRSVLAEAAAIKEVAEDEFETKAVVINGGDASGLLHLFQAA
jgi:hypothetical protein